MEERDLHAVRAGARRLVDEADAARPRACEVPGEVVHLEAHVVQAGAARVDELRHGVLGRARLEQLQCDRAQVHEHDAERAAVQQLLVAPFRTETLDERLRERVRVARGDRDVREPADTAHE